MNFLTHNDATVAVTEILVEDIVSDLEVIVEAKRMQLGTAFTHEDGTVSALLRSISSLSRASHLFTVTENLTHPDALNAFFEAASIINGLGPLLAGLKGASTNDAKMPS